MGERATGPDEVTSLRILLAPTRADSLDASFLAVLATLALLEFQSTFGGVAYLVVGLTGLALGVALSHLAKALKQPAVILVALLVGAFFLFGGAVALRSAPGVSPLPTGSTLTSLATVAIYGWKDLLTTLPRVDGVGTLLALPYLLGLFCGLSGHALATRTRFAFLPLLAPLSVFVAVILLGSVNPQHTVLLACVFALGAFLWGTVRSHRVRPVVDSGSGRASRLAAASVLLVGAAGGAALFGGSIPGSGSQDRVVLRKYVNPPPMVDNYVSPLSEFRQYVGHQRLNGKVVSLADHQLLSVQGTVPVGTPIRFATLDRYNGAVWAASTDPDAAYGAKPNAFIRVGKTLDNPAAGPTYSMSVSVDDYKDYWLPTAGSVQSLAFTDAAAPAQAQAFRYNLATGSGLESNGITKGTTYDLTVADVKPRNLKPGDQLAGDGYSESGAFLKETAAVLSGGKGSTTEQVLRIASSLRSLGRYTHGDPGTSFQYYLPGHAMGRLVDFVKGVLPGILYVGDDEQYASAFALMVQQLGVPARVVVGVNALPSSRTISGKDVEAWVEVKGADGAWRTIPTAVFIDKNNPPDKKQLKQKKNQLAGSIVPPPAQGRPKASADDAAQSNSDSASQRKRSTVHAGFHLPAWVSLALRVLGPPILVIAMVVVLIATIKALRRRRRRLQGSPSVRLTRAWRELTDHARDLGTEVPARLTRREQARHIGSSEVGSLAWTADERVFGPLEIREEDAHAFWQQVENTKKLMSASTGRARRLFAMINLATFFPPRSRVAQS